MLDKVIHESAVGSVFAELENLAEEAPEICSGAIIILKNELEPGDPAAPKRAVLFDRTFVLPGSLAQRIGRTRRKLGPIKLASELASDFWLWLTGRDGERFRDRCDRCFWQTVVPEVTASFGTFADRVLNTINEAIINYAEYSFHRRAVRRRIHVHLFKTDGDLAYVIIRPSGSRLRSFDPLALKTREHGPTQPRKRGWGHTLLMERALFLSFDHNPKRRGMLIIIGPENAAE